MNVLLLRDPSAQRRAEPRPLAPGALRDPRPPQAEERPGHLPCGLTLSQPLPKRRGTGWWAAVAVAMHAMLLAALMTSKPLSAPPTRLPAPSTSMRWVDVKLPPLPARSRNPSSASLSPSLHSSPSLPLSSQRDAPSQGVSSSLVAPPMVKSPPMEQPPAPSLAHPLPTGSSVSPLVPLVSLTGSADAPSVAETARAVREPATQTTDRPASPTSPQDGGRGLPPLMTAERPAPAMSQDQPASFPANHRACQDTQTTRYYPAMLRDRGVQGRVLLRVKVDAHGRAAEVQVATGSGLRLLDEAARRVAESCPYVPARRGDQPVESWIEYAVRFALSPAVPGPGSL